MARRKASFIGSPEWEKKDVERQYIPLRELCIYIDKPSGIRFTVPAELVAQSSRTLLLDLAHRVRQLS